MRAYSDSTIGVIQNSNKINMDLGYLAFFEIEYSDLGKVQYYFQKKNIEIVNQEFQESIKIFVNLTEEKYNKIVENKEELKFEILSFGKIEKKYIKNIDIF